MKGAGQFVVVAVLTAILATVAYFAFWRHSTPAAVPTGVESVKDAAGLPPAASEPAPPAKPGPVEPATTAGSGRAAAPRPGRGPARGAGNAELPTARVDAPPVIAPPGPTPAAATADTGARRTSATATRASTFFLPGSRTGWTTTGMFVSGPTVVRAAGQVNAGEDVAGPGGLSSSAYETELARHASPSRPNERVLNNAPYLSLIGRVCSAETCSAPFAIGPRMTICPSAIGVSGSLQVWTNNYVRVAGTRTLLGYSRLSGGFSLSAEPTGTSACSASASPVPAAAPVETSVFSAGQVLDRSDFRVSSSQTQWKPIFIPLDRPLLIRASGQMRPAAGAAPTGPEGLRVAAGEKWSYPGASGLVIDRENQLFDPSLPYQALIGRLCSPTDCGAPFLIGRERTICPAPPANDRLEVWLNHIIGPVGLLGSRTPLAFDTLKMQARSGEYTFVVQAAPAGACGRSGGL